MAPPQRNKLKRLVAEQDTGEILRKGLCSDRVCGQEAACVQKGDSYFCDCPNGGRPTKDLHCPRVAGEQFGEVVRRGRCSDKVCGLEAGCVQKGDSYLCVCPHEGRPTKDLRCPRVTVTDRPKPFAVIPHRDSPVGNWTFPNISNSTTPSPVVEAGGGGLWVTLSSFLLSHITAAAVLFVIILFGLSLMICLYVSYRRRVRLTLARKSTSIPMATPVSLKKGVIGAERFATNPSYMGTDSSPVCFPLIPHESILFQNSQCIGEGCFGKVFKGEFRRADGHVETVAIKVLKDSASEEAENDFMREVEIMSAFQHENILSLLGVALKDIGKNPCMVFEFMPYGDLTEVLRSNSKQFWKPDIIVPRLNKESMLSIARQIACGMKYLAGQHFVHRDLACRNCLVGNNLTVKIADFGMSRDVYTCDYYRIGGHRLMPVRWMAPESVTYGRFTLESDIWSFGVVLWEIYSLGKQPYFGHTNEEVITLVNHGERLIPPDDCPQLICELMHSCWRTEPKDRPTFTELYSELMTPTPQLPQPPPSPVTAHAPLRVEEYLSPNPRPPHDYLQPLPD